MNHWMIFMALVKLVDGPLTAAEYDNLWDRNRLKAGSIDQR